MSLPERLGGLCTAKDDQPVAKKEEKLPLASDPDSGQVQRCVMIQKDEKGYGLTVSGDNPVFVQSVKPDGAAARAGVQQGDKIIRVNGNSALKLNHTDVVSLIKSGSCVVLMLLGKSSGQLKSMESKDNSSSNKRVTAPQPVDQEKEEDMRQQKIQTIEKMLSLQQEECEKVRKIYNKYPSEKVQGELNEKEKTVRTLENQLRQMTVEYQTDYTGLGLPDTLPARLPGGSKHIKHGSVPASIYKTRDVVDIRDISVSRSKSDASSKHSQVAAGGGSDPSYPLLPSGYHQRDFIKERSSLPISSSDISSSCDSPQASPSNSPTPIHPTNMNWSNVDAEDFASSSHIMCFEDDDQDEESSEENEDYKPFQHLQEVEKRKAYLSILLHYLISNDDPSALFFYVITEIYASAPGNAKELRKWAYEIYSTFLIPEAPLRVTVDEKFIKAIDDFLNTKSDKEDCLRCIFQQSRYDAQSAVKCMLKEFWNKQKLGLGNIYGVDELKLNLDKSQEAKIIEKHLMPHMENFMEDRAKSARDQAQGWALATFLRHVGVPKPSSHSNILERVQSFVMKERKEKGIKLPGSRSKTKTHRNHQYVPQHYYVLTECVHCHSIIWGVGYQGYQCSNCEQNVHKQCIELVDVSCAPVKKKNTKRTSGLMDKWGRKPSSISDRRESCSPTQVGVSAFQSSNTDEDCDPVNNLVQRFEKKSPGDSEDERHKRGTDLGRSESLKDRPDPKGDRRTRRAKSDVEMDENTMKALNNSGSSSTSSLQSGRSLDSPSNSNEAVNDVSINSTPSLNDDSDMEVQTDLPHLNEILSDDILRKMKPKEKKRQEVINELFHTERAHMRNMKILDQLFNKPMLKTEHISQELVKALFPNLEKIISLHRELNEAMKTRRKESPLISGVGDILLKRFDGEDGEEFKKNCAIFCRNQSSALETLRLKQRKDQRLAQFLMDAESSSMCRRLQLKDLIPAEMQRLTKYRLLIENLLKYTTTNTEEYMMLEKSQKLSKRILEFVNQAVQDCENHHRLRELQRRLDKRQFENLPDIDEEFRNFDLTKHKLIHDGFLTWHINQSRNKTIDVHVVLLEDLLVFLQKQDDRLVLKCHDTTMVQGAEPQKYTHSPILKIGNVLTRNVATNKKGFFVVNTSNTGPQIYQLTAPSIEDQKKWFKCIESATEVYLQKNSSHSKLNPSIVPISAAATASSTAASTPSSTGTSSTTTTVTTTTTTTTTSTAAAPAPADKLNKTDSIDTEQIQNTSTLKEKDSEEPIADTIGGISSVQKVGESQQSEVHFAGPEDVIVSDVSFVEAESVQSPVEKLRRNDDLIKQVLKEREKLIAEILNIPYDDYVHIVEMASEETCAEERRKKQKQQQQQQRQNVDLQELILRLIDQAKQLTELIVTSTQSHGLVANTTTTTTEHHSTVSSLSAAAARAENQQVSIPISMDKLRDMSNKLNTLMTNLLTAIHDDERMKLRQELKSAQEQIKQLQETKRLMCAAPASMPSSLSVSASSRPNSMISTTSSASEQYEETVPEQADLIDSEGRKMIFSTSQEMPHSFQMSASNSIQPAAPSKDSAESDNESFEDVSTELVERSSISHNRPISTVAETICQANDLVSQDDSSLECSATQLNASSLSSSCDDTNSVQETEGIRQHQSTEFSNANLESLQI